MKFQLLKKTNLYIYIRQIEKLLALSLSDVKFIMLINVNIYQQDKFRAQLSWAWKKKLTSGARILE